MTLSYAKKVGNTTVPSSFALMVESIGWGWEDKRGTTQTHFSKVVAGGVNQLNQTSVIASGRFYDSDEKERFALFVQEWQRQAVGRAIPSPLRLILAPMMNRADSTIPDIKMDFLVLVTDMPAGSTRFSVAPEWNITFTIVRDMIDIPTYKLSAFAKSSQWWWQKGYAGDLIKPRSVLPTQVVENGEDAFNASDPAGGGGGFSVGGDSGGIINALKTGAWFTGAGGGGGAD
jgi:hypothetical protein